MRIGPYEITIKKAIPGNLASVESRGGWWPVVRESYAGAWQENVEVTLSDVLTHPTVFACVSLISSDISKMSLQLARLSDDGVWLETDNPAFTPVIRKPNRYQTSQQFIEQWVLSLQVWGNTYILKQRDERNVVVAMYVLDPQRVRPLVAPDSSVYYELKRDDLSSQPQDNVTVPASEIIHDRINTVYHPLVGLSPIHASGVSAVLGLRIRSNSATFFGNSSTPSGVLTAPGAITPETAARVKTYWESEFTGDNAGKVAVLSDGLRFEQMSVPADKSQLSEQWDAASKDIASAFKVPWHMAGGPLPNYNNVQALTVQYFTQCLQSPAKRIEDLLDFGLGLAPNKIGGVRLGTMFDVSDLLWMDSQTMMKVITDGVKGGVFTPNEARKMLNKTSLPGGDTVYLQEQDHALEALARRDAKPDPFAKTPSDTPAPSPPQTRLETNNDKHALMGMVSKGLRTHAA